MGVAKRELLRRAEQAERHFHPGSDLAKHVTQYKGWSCIDEYYIVRLGMVRWSIWLDEKTVAALKKIGDEEDRPVGWLIRKAVEEFIQRRKQGK
ncbi:MAG: hypothetical protein DMG97_29145 [Acidobacteria bacterium]|nr:MAG: hypothetical protein DMG97_29145 [Acidobacteriota bacterium]